MSGEIFCRFLFWQTVSKSQQGSEQAAKRHRGKEIYSIHGHMVLLTQHHLSLLVLKKHICWAQRRLRGKLNKKKNVSKYRLFPVTLLHSTKQSFKNTAEIWNGRRGATTSSDLDLMLLCSVSSPLFWRQLCVLLYISNYSTSSTTSWLIWAESSASEWIRIWAESNFDSEVSNFYPDGDRKASSACPRKLHTFVLRLNWALTRL